MENAYTINDCFVLKGLFNSNGETALSILFYDEVIIKARDIAQKKMLDKEDIYRLIKNFIILGYSSSKIFMITNFLFSKALEEVPLYINDSNLIIYVKWRLKIAK